MKRLLQMIQLLLAMNTVSFRKDREFFDNLLAMMRKQGLLMDKIKDLAKQEGTLLGRIITFPAGDGKCIYVITKVYPKVAPKAYIFPNVSMALGVRKARMASSIPIREKKTMVRIGVRYFG